MINLVELVADQADCAFDQPCIYGHRVERHAVYCHNEKWANSPRKCRHTWYYKEIGTGKEDKDCPGFKLNPDYKEGEG